MPSRVLNPIITVPKAKPISIARYADVVSTSMIQFPMTKNPGKMSVADVVFISITRKAETKSAAPSMDLALNSRYMADDIRNSVIA